MALTKTGKSTFNQITVESGNRKNVDTKHQGEKTDHITILHSDNLSEAEESSN